MHKWVSEITRFISIPAKEIYFFGNSSEHRPTIYTLTYSMVQSPREAKWFVASQEISAFHGTRKFITALTRVRQLSLSWASPIQSIHPHPTSWRSILILSTHLRLGLRETGGKEILLLISLSCMTTINPAVSVKNFTILQPYAR